MPIVVSWDNEEKHILRHDFAGRWTLSDLNDAAENAWDMMHSVHHRVDVIMDVRHGNVTPSGFLSQCNRIMLRRPANAGVIVVVGASSLLISLYYVFMRTYAMVVPRFTLLFADSVEEARSKLQDIADKRASAH